MQELLDEIDSTVAGQDLKAICGFDPKISGRIYVKPIGGAGSKTYIEKDPAGQYIFASLSNGVPFGAQTHSDAETAFRHLWAYIISKNAPAGYKKKELAQWLIDPNNPFWGKGKGMSEILENFRRAYSPAGMAQKEDFFTDPRYSVLPSIGITIDSSGEKLAIRLKMLPGEIGMVNLLEESKLVGSLKGIAIGLFYSPMQECSLDLNVIPKKIFAMKPNHQGNIGCSIEDLTDIEIKILTKIKDSLDIRIGYAKDIYALSGTAFKKEFKSLVISLHEACIKNRIQMIDDFLSGKISTSLGFNVPADAIEMIAKFVQDAKIILKLPSDIAKDVFIAQGYTESEITSLLDAGDMGIL